MSPVVWDFLNVLLGLSVGRLVIALLGRVYVWDVIREIIKYMIWFIILIIGLIPVLIVIFELRKSQTAFWIEESIAHDRWISVFAWFCIGLSITIAANYKKHTNTKKLFKLQILFQGFILSVVCFLIVLLVDPKIIDRITSIKAAGVEAHFSESAGRLRSAPIRFLDIATQSALSKWEKFDDDDDFALQTAEGSPADTTYRAIAYRVSDEDLNRRRLADLIFKHTLKGLFVIASCYETKGLLFQLKTDPDVIRFSTSFASLLRRSLQVGGDRGTDDTEHDELVRLHIRSLSLQRKLDESLRKQGQYDCIGPAWPDTNQEEKIVEDLKGMPLSSYIDGYILTAASDLIAFTQSDLDKANFLEDIKIDIVGQYAPCASGCKYAPPSLTNFYYYLSNAKARSEGVWDLAETTRDMRRVIQWVDSFIVADDHALRTTSEEAEKLRKNYLLIKLEDTSLLLEIFNRHSLGGEALTREDLVNWRETLIEGRSIISAILGGNRNEGLTEKDLQDWRKARNFILSIPENLFDATTAVALSSILLPEA